MNPVALHLQAASVRDDNGGRGYGGVVNVMPRLTRDDDSFDDGWQCPQLGAASGGLLAAATSGASEEQEEAATAASISRGYGADQHCARRDLQSKLTALVDCGAGAAEHPRREPTAPARGEQRDHSLVTSTMNETNFHETDPSMEDERDKSNVGETLACDPGADKGEEVASDGDCPSTDEEHIAPPSSSYHNKPPEEQQAKTVSSSTSNDQQAVSVIASGAPERQLPPARPVSGPSQTGQDEPQSTTVLRLADLGRSFEPETEHYMQQRDLSAQQPDAQELAFQAGYRHGRRESSLMCEAFDYQNSQHGSQEGLDINLGEYLGHSTNSSQPPHQVTNLNQLQYQADSSGFHNEASFQYPPASGGGEQYAATHYQSAQLFAVSSGQTGIEGAADEQQQLYLNQQYIGAVGHPEPAYHYQQPRLIMQPAHIVNSYVERMDEGTAGQQQQTGGDQAQASDAAYLAQTTDASKQPEQHYSYPMQTNVDLNNNSEQQHQRGGYPEQAAKLVSYNENHDNQLIRYDNGAKLADYRQCVVAQIGAEGSDCQYGSMVEQNCVYAASGELITSSGDAELHHGVYYHSSDLIEGRALASVDANYTELDGADKTYHLLGEGNASGDPMNHMSESHYYQCSAEFQQHQQGTQLAYNQDASAKVELWANPAGAQQVPTVCGMYDPNDDLNTSLLDGLDFDGGSTEDERADEPCGGTQSRKSLMGASMQPARAGSLRCAPETIEKLRIFLERRRQSRAKDSAVNEASFKIPVITESFLPQMCHLYEPADNEPAKDHNTYDSSSPNTTSKRPSVSPGPPTRFADQTQTGEVANMCHDRPGSSDNQNRNSSPERDAKQLRSRTILLNDVESVIRNNPLTNNTTCPGVETRASKRRRYNGSSSDNESISESESTIRIANSC